MLADFIFNLQGMFIPLQFIVISIEQYTYPGLVNVILLLSTRHLIPDTAFLPSFSTQRKTIDFNSSEAVGITPFILPPKPEEAAVKPERSAASEPAQNVESATANIDLEAARVRDSIGSVSVYSNESSLPMVQKPQWSITRPMSWRK